MTELSTYLTANAYKCLMIVAKGMGTSIEQMLPSLKICETDESLVFYLNDKPIFQQINNVWHDAGLNLMDIKSVKINMFDKSLTLNKMRKRQKNIVVITFE